MCNNTLGILIIWGGGFDYLGDFEYFWGDFLRMILEIKYMFFIMN